MPFKLIGKSTLGELGFCLVPKKMGSNFEQQLKKVIDELRVFENKTPLTITMTAMTSIAEINLTANEYVPKIRVYTPEFQHTLSPQVIYKNCESGRTESACDFIVWDSRLYPTHVATTFSREAPILAFLSDTGKKSLGVILRPSLMTYGDYLFSTMNKLLEGNIQVIVVTCNHYEYSEGSIPSIVQNLANKYGMNCYICENSEENPECYKRGEEGNHVVALK